LPTWKPGERRRYSRFLDADPRISDRPEFTPEEIAVVYAILENGVENLWRQPIDGTAGSQITNFQTDVFKSYQYAPDGKTLGVVRLHRDSDVVLPRIQLPSNLNRLPRNRRNCDANTAVPGIKDAWYTPRYTIAAATPSAWL
jgi:hypothetical protein